MAIFKDKTGRGEVDYAKSPVQSSDGTIIFLNDHTASTENIFAQGLQGHLVFQLRGEDSGVKDVSNNRFSVTESSVMTKRQEFVTHTQKLKTFEFAGGKTLTLSPIIKDRSQHGMVFRPGVGGSGMETILPYFDGAAGPEFSVAGEQECIISFWLYVESYGDGDDGGGSCIMETVNGTSRSFGIILSSTGEITFRFYDFGSDSTGAVEFQQIKTQNVIPKKTWSHITVFFRGYGSSNTHDKKPDYNTGGLDARHQTRTATIAHPAQVEIFINGNPQKNPSEAGKTSGEFTGVLGAAADLPLVLGSGLAGYDNGTPQFQAGSDANFNGRLAEVNYFYTQKLGISSKTNNYRTVVAKALMTGNRQPTSGITGLSERLLLRDLDQNSTHPTVKRSGDQRRLGNHSTKFDDSRAQTLKGSTVQYPTKLVKGDKLIDTIYSGYFNGDLTLTNIPSVESYDTFYRRNDQPAHEPFVESRIYIDSGSNFYQTGTLETVIPGFDAPLSRKSNFSITLPNGQVGVFAPNHSSVSGPLTEMLSGSFNDFVSGSSEHNSAGAVHTQYRPSMFYLDNSVDLFKPLIDEGSNGYGGFKRSSLLAGYTSKSGSAEAQTDRILNDLRCGFAPTWDQGFLIEVADDPDNYIFAGEAIKRNLGGPIDSFGFPQDKKYEADDSFTVKLSDHIQAPFVAEKIVITANVEGTLGFATDISFTTFDSQPGKWSPGTTTYSSDVPTGTKNLSVTTQRPHSFATAISWENNNKFHSYVDASAYPQDTQLDTYTFFMLRQFPSTGSVQNNSVEVFGRRQVLGGNENKVLLFSGSSQAAKQSRELIHFSKIGAGRTTPRSSITQGFKDIHNLLISNLTSSLDAFVDVPFGSIESFDTTISSINSIQSLPITASMPGSLHPNLQALSKNFAFTGSIRIEKPVEAAARSTFNGLFLLPDTPTGILGMSATPRTFANAIVWTGNSAGGTMYNPDNLAGTRAFGPGNISSINPDNNATYKTLLSLTRDTGAINAVTSSITTVFSDVTNAPLVLMPEDKLIMGFQVPTDAMSLFNPLHFSTGISDSTTYSVSAEGGGNTTARRFSEARIVENKKLKFTDFTITFFGSYVRNSQPQQFQLNQMLSNDIIHEAIGQESISDQFDIEPRGAFTGSYVDEVMSGSSDSATLYSGFDKFYGEHYGAAISVPSMLHSLGESESFFIIFNDASFSPASMDNQTIVLHDRGTTLNSADVLDNRITHTFTVDKDVTAANSGPSNKIGVSGLSTRAEFIDSVITAVNHPNATTAGLVRASAFMSGDTKTGLRFTIVDGLGAEYFGLGTIKENAISGTLDGLLSVSPTAKNYINGTRPNFRLARAVGSRNSEGTQGTQGSLRRNVSHVTSDVTEFDSFLFDLQSLFEVDERSENVPDNGDFGLDGNYTDDFETGSNKVDTLLVSSDPTTIGTTQDFDKNVVPNVNAGTSFLNARYHTVRKVRMPQIGRAADTFNVIVTGSHNNNDSMSVPGLLETDQTSTFQRSFGLDGKTNLTPENTAKLIFGLGEGVSNAHVAGFDSNRGQFIGWESIRGFRYGLSNVKDRKPRVVFRRDRYGQLRDMLEMAPNTAYIDDKTNTIVRAIEAQFFADDGSIASPEATSCSNLSTFVTSSAPFFDREVINFEDTEVVRNRGPLNNKVADITIEI